MFIDYSNFTGDCNLGIIKGSENEVKLNLLITDIEKKYLYKILGNIEYHKLITSPTNTEWVKFLNGETLACVGSDGLTYYINYTGAKKVLTYLTYFHYIREHYTQMTQSGEKIRTDKNSTPLYPDHKMTANFNKAVELIGFDHVNYPVAGYDNYCNTIFNWMYQYNIQHPTIFNNLDFSNLNYTNEYGF